MSQLPPIEFPVPGPEVDSSPIVVKEGDDIVSEIPSQRFAMPSFSEEDYHLSESWYCEGIPRGGNAPRADAMATCSSDGNIYVSYQHPTVLVVHKSADQGRTWEKVDVVQPPPNRQYGVVSAFGAVPDGSLVVMYSGRLTPSPRWSVPMEDPAWTAFGRNGWSHFARSEDGGVTWHFMHKVDKGQARLVQGLGQIKPLADGSVIATSTLCMEDGLHADHIWRSADGGKSFELSNSISPHSGETKIEQLPSGRLLAAVRTVHSDYMDPRNKRTAMITSDDNGQTWSEHVMLTTDIGDCPGEFVALPDGRAVFLYCKRYAPAAIVARISPDGGQTWNSQTLLVRQMEGDNPGVYPSSLLIDDQTILTISSTIQGTPPQAIRWQVPGE